MKRLVPLLAAVAFLAAVASPAAAHGGSNALENLATQVIGVPDGLEVQVHSDGSMITIRATSEIAAVVLGEKGEPFVRVSRDWYAWSDHRVAWDGAALPTSVMQDPGHSHQVATWSIPVRVDGEMQQITGRVVWVPTAAPTSWTIVLVAGLIAIVIAVAAVAAFPRKQQHRRSTPS